MSPANVELVRRVYEGIARGDVVSVLAAYDPDVEMDFSRSGPGALISGVYRGHDGLREANREWYELWEDLRFEDYELTDLGDQVLVSVMVRGRGRASGVDVEMPLHGVWTIAGGRVVRTVWFATRDAAQEAAARADRSDPNDSV